MVTLLELKSVLKVFSEADVKTISGVVPGQIRKPLVGVGGGTPSERLRLRLATFEPGTHEPLHWHLVEALYYVISGSAVSKDIEGKSYELGPGSVVYAPPGIVGAHSWTVKEKLQLLSIRATNGSEAMFQFTVDEDSKRSFIDLASLNARTRALQRSLYTE